MVYTKASHQRAVLTSAGLQTLLSLICDEVPFELHEQASHVLMNATSLKEAKGIRLACAGGAVEALQRKHPEAARSLSGQLRKLEALAQQINDAPAPDDSPRTSASGKKAHKKAKHQAS